MAIETDMKKWKQQNADLETKFESIAIKQKNQLMISEFLKNEYFSN